MGLREISREWGRDDDVIGRGMPTLQLTCAGALPGGRFRFGSAFVYVPMHIGSLMTSFTPKEIWRNRKSGLWTGTVTSIRSGWSDDCCCFSSGSYGLEQFSDLQCEGRCTLKCPFQLQNQFLPFSLSVGSLVYIYGWNNCISFTRGRPADAVICSSAHPPLLSFPEQPCQCLTLIDTLSKNCLLFLLPYFFCRLQASLCFPLFWSRALSLPFVQPTSHWSRTIFNPDSSCKVCRHNRGNFMLNLHCHTV